MNAAYHREYRIRRGEELREYNRVRRRRPDVRAQRHASEQRRRRAIRAARPADVPMQHPLLDIAAALVPMPKPGRLLQFRPELTAEDARSEAVLALIEGRDPRSAIRAFNTVERTWTLHADPLFTWEGASGS